jgi:UDP-N-acetyl-D-glucosamine dehydrogenase
MNKDLLIKMLLRKFETKKARVGIVGLGYVGVPLALRLIEVGYDVVGYDTDQQKVRLLTAGKRCFSHIDPLIIKKHVANEKLKVYSMPDELSYCDVVIICVPTPITASREPDMTCLEEACCDISRNMRKGQLIVLESTTYPGTTEGLVQNTLSQNANDFELGIDYFLAFSPEREDPGNKDFNVKNTPKVVSGCTEECKKLAYAFYSTVVDKPVLVSSPATAEMVKILENTYRAVNIALVNELKVLCHRLGIDIWEVIQAASTKPFGFQAFYPGVGYGGHCIAADPYYLTWRARQVETPTKFIELASEVNWEMSRYVVQRIQQALNAHNKALKDSQVLVLGVAYKKNIGDLRESPALKVIRDLIRLEAKVCYHDPYANQARIDLQENGWATLESVELTDDCIQKQDCVVLLVDHDCLDYIKVTKQAKIIVDTRNRFNVKDARVVQA